MFLASPTGINSSHLKSFDSQESRYYKGLYRSPDSQDYYQNNPLSSSSRNDKSQGKIR
jgi:hypothetical protein